MTSTRSRILLSLICFCALFATARAVLEKTDGSDNAAGTIEIRVSTASFSLLPSLRSTITRGLLAE